MEKRIILTGGGTAGHVTPHLALLPYLREDGWEIHYVGTENGIERQLIEPLEGVSYHCIQSGRFRRYFTLKNFTDPFRVLKGFFQSKGIVREIRPHVLFSKGGFVSVPCVFASHRYHVPVVLHESDYTAGLANKLSAPRATIICTSFDPKLSGIKGRNVLFTGSPIRKELLSGSKERGREWLSFDEKPVLLVMGGSQGSLFINQAVEAVLQELLTRYNIVHVRGKGLLNPSIAQPGYAQFEYIEKELADCLALSDMVIGRAGANTIFELLALSKPSLLIPLPKEVSRGDQILNARYCENMGYAKILYQENMIPSTLLSAIEEVWGQAETLTGNMAASPGKDGTRNVLKAIYQAVGFPFPFGS